MAYGGGNITFSNHSERTANGSAASAFDYCHSLYLHSRILVPLLHAVVTTVGLSINLCMMLVLFRDLRRPSTGSLTRSGSLRGVSWNFQYFLFHIGLCHICMLTTIPVWITQTVFAQGWIFGYAGCKAVKGLITFSMQYGILTTVYINAERFVRVVYNKTRIKCGNSKTRIRTCLLCACLPAISCLTDVYFYTTVELGRNVVMCVSTADPRVKLAVLWIRTIICFVAPVAVLALCNGALVYTVKRHVRKVSLLGVIPRSSLKGAQIIPLLTVTFFVCCWIPWIVSSVYYSFSQVRVRCPVTVFTVINVSMAVGNVHCVMTPAMYLFVRARRAKFSQTTGRTGPKWFSLRK
ncbi:hypothetical protein Q5P01_000730 [Channa striata]|uniref:G-protein coupled receptors family 1 profile domain-containing protein n=1 Tax=Channa striata TaxID=64152 RepID=A0AA88IWZ7_CHASR|nr:hypothetical protein Q5P01_000730 [Channa striata]